MSDNEELILGFCPLPEIKENATGQCVSNENEKSPIVSEEADGEVITGDIVYRISVEHGVTNNVKSSRVPNSVDSVIAEALSESIADDSEFVNHTESVPVTIVAPADETSERPAKRRRQTLVKGTLQCAECRELCADFDVYTAHMSTHSTVPLYTCPKCLYVFADQSLYESHTAQTCRAAGNSKDKECAVCMKTFKYDSHLREHIICMHNKTPLFTCPICGLNITCWRRSIDRHMSNHANQIKCPTCGLKGESIEVVEAHILESGENHLQCKTCEYTSSSRHEFFSHVNVHIPKVDLLEPMVCYKCSHRFQRTSEFNNHVRFFCKLREGHQEAPAIKIEVDVSEQPEQQQNPESIPQLQICSSDGNQGVIDIANIVTDPTKQIITLPEGANNNTFIPITLTSGEDLGQGLGPNTTVIIIPQILFMPQNASGTAQDGTSGIIASGQNDQVIYLECVKSEQSGIFSVAEMPGDKTAVENFYLSQVPQTIVQEIEQPIESRKEEEERELSESKSCIPVSSADNSNLPVENVYNIAVAPSSETTSDPIAESSTHQDETVGPPALVCSLCREVLRDSESYGIHMKQHEKPKVKRSSVVVKPKQCSAFKCEECGQGFAAKHHLEQHSVTFHSDGAGVVCPVCRVVMASEKTSLNEHLAKVHNLRVEPSGKLTDCSEN